MSDKHIIVQTAAKIAGELTAMTDSKNPEDIVRAFKYLFTEVTDSLLDTVASHEDKSPKRREIPVLSQDEMEMKLQEAREGAPVGRSVKKSKGAGVTIKGSTEPAPAWLVRAAEKAGVTEVWDNRGNLKDNPKRPHFVSTDEDKKAFWPPKAETTSIHDFTKEF